jgi:hypothetical protein
MCTVLLTPGVNPIAVNEMRVYNIIYIVLLKFNNSMLTYNEIEQVNGLRPCFMIRRTRFRFSIWRPAVQADILRVLFSKNFGVVPS